MAGKKKMIDLPPIPIGEEGIAFGVRSKPVRSAQAGEHVTPFLDLEKTKLDFDKPMFLCFSGIESCNPKEANGFAKLMESILGGPSAHDAGGGTQFVSAIYQPLNLAQKSTRMASLQLGGLEGWEWYNRPLAERYAQHTVKKLFAETDAVPDVRGLQGREREAAISVAERRLSNVNLVGYSFGTYLLPFVHDALQEHMKEKGYERQEAEKALRKVHATCFGETGLWHHQARPAWDFTSVHFVSTDDALAGKIAGFNRRVGQENKRDGIFRFGEDGHVMLFVSKIPNYAETVSVERISGWKHAARRWGLIEKTKPGWEIEKKQPDRTGHDPRTYAGMRVMTFPYFTEEGGQWFMPSALHSVLRNNHLTSGNPEERGEAAALLAPVGEVAKLKRDKESPVYWPANASYRKHYERTVGHLLAQAETEPLPPARQQEKWGEMIREGMPDRLPEPMDSFTARHHAREEKKETSESVALS